LSIKLADPSRVSIDEFTEAAFTGVLRALAAQQPTTGRPIITRPGPIIYGIIYLPDAGQIQVQAINAEDVKK
jgi:hypothetical protein